MFVHLEKAPSHQHGSVAVIRQLAVPPRADGGTARELITVLPQSTTRGSCVFYEQQREGKSSGPSATVGLIVDRLISRHCEEILTLAPCMERHNGQF